MNLREKIVVREEDSGFLLYNGDNGGLVHLSHEAFDRFVSRGMTYGDGYDALHTWLFQNGFLETSSTDSQSEASASDCAAGMQGFFNLRS